MSCIYKNTIEISQSYGRIAPRSGLVANFGIHVGAGVIDPDYFGEIKVVLFNLSDSDYFVEIGHRVAQIICEKYCSPICEMGCDDLKCK